MGNRKILYAASILLFFFSGKAFSQHVRTFDNSDISSLLHSQGSTHHVFKLSLVAGFKKGLSIGLGYAIWDEHPFFQYSLNTAIQYRIGGRFLGNYYDIANLKDSRSHSQLVFTFSPLLTMNLTNRDFVYQEIEPFYLGTPNAVYSKYRNSVTIGSTFSISPRGTYKNIATVRNRSQQVFMLGLNIADFNFTVVDDYFPIATKFFQLGDNWDRYFTGGGFVRYRFNDNYTLHLYSEVYTGIVKPQAFMNQDIISYRKRRKGRWSLKNFANQNAGQEFLNSSWFIAKLTYSGNSNVAAHNWNMPSFDFMLGSSAPWTMFSQNWVHSIIGYDETNHFKLHFFMNRANVPGNSNAGEEDSFKSAMNNLFFAGGMHSSFIVQ